MFHFIPHLHFFFFFLKQSRYFPFDGSLCKRLRQQSPGRAKASSLALLTDLHTVCCLPGYASASSWRSTSGDLNPGTLISILQRSEQPSLLSICLPATALVLQDRMAPAFLNILSPASRLVSPYCRYSASSDKQNLKTAPKPQVSCSYSACDTASC